MTEIVAAHLERVARELAPKFHEAYERLAPQFGYETRKDSAVPWEQVPERNRKLMEAVCKEVVAAALAACAREERERAYAAICQLCEAQIPLDANGRHTGSGHVGSHCYATLIRRALERAVGEKPSLDPQGGQHDS